MRSYSDSGLVILLNEMTDKFVETNAKCFWLQIQEIKQEQFRRDLEIKYPAVS